MCVGECGRDFLFYIWSELTSFGYAGRDTSIVIRFHCSVLVRMYRLLVSKVNDVVLCMVIVLIEKDTEERLEAINTEVVLVRDTEERLEAINTEVVLVRGMFEECTKIIQYDRDVLVGFIACLL